MIVPRKSGKTNTLSAEIHIKYASVTDIITNILHYFSRVVKRSSVFDFNLPVGVNINWGL